jgi:WD40 repeat protein
MHLGSGGRKATLFTCSEDRFVKVYSLLSGTMLLSIAFPQPLSSIVTDAAERTMFIGGNDGVIYIFNISTPPRSLEHQITHDEAADGILKKHGTRYNK